MAAERKPNNIRVVEGVHTFDSGELTDQAETTAYAVEIGMADLLGLINHDPHPVMADQKQYSLDTVVNFWQEVLALQVRRLRALSNELAEFAKRDPGDGLISAPRFDREAFMRGELDTEGGTNP